MGKAESYETVLDGAPSVVLRKLFFFMQNAVMRGKFGDEKALELMSQVDGKALEFLYEKFCEEEGIKEAALDEGAVKKDLKKELGTPAEPEDRI